MCRSCNRTNDSPRVSFAGLVLVFLLFAAAAPAQAQDITLGFGDEQVPDSGIPKPWQLLGHPSAGQPEFGVEDDKVQGRVLRLHAKGNQSDGIYRVAEVDLTKTPFINFAWKVAIHPKGQVGTDKSDQAVKIQLDFGRFRFKRRVLSYVYDPAAEAGQWYDDSSFFAVNRALALNSGSEQLGQWLSHSRDVAADYQSRYRSAPPTLKNVSIFCDSNDSNSESLGYCSEITFSQEPRTRPDEPDKPE